jgi:acetyl esterase/lipase
MPTTRSIDPELAAVLDSMPHTKYGAFNLDDIPGTRAMMQQMTEQMSAGIERDPAVATSDIIAHRPDGTDLALRVHRPVDAPEAAPALLWFHAGGQILGTASEDDLYLAQLAKTLTAVVIAVDYRLAPEHQAPASAEDGLTAYRHVLDHAAAIGVDAARVAIGGASGGGAPALSTALMIRDQHLPTPAALTLLYPMIDDRNTTQSSREITDVGVWDREANLLAWHAVLGDRAGTDDVSAYAAPARATDVSGLPATFIAVGEYDLFRDEDVNLANQLLSAGVRTELHLYAGAIHAFDRFVPGSALAQELDAAWHRFLTRTLADNS